MSRMQPRNAKVPEPRSQQLRLDLLHTFESAARHLSFTKAGEELFLSQSAVSRISTVLAPGGRWPEPA